MISRYSSSALLVGTAFFLPVAAPAYAQDSTPQPTGQPATTPAAQDVAPATGDEGDEEEIVITGQRARGSVLGDIPPEKVLSPADIRATGATSITDLLDALAPEIGSARGRGGGQPVLLLNGQRISSFREMRDIPTEAIQRVEILPEEVALKYGYGADQRVVNIVLRQRFRSTVAQLGGTVPTAGGEASGNADVTRLMIQRNGRTQVNLHAEGNSMLTEAERDIRLRDGPPDPTDPQELAARSLIGSRRDVRGSAVFNRQILGNVSATLNTELEHSEGHSLIGLGNTSLVALDRNTSSDSAHAGVTLNWDKSQWRFNVTGNADWDRSVTGTDRDNPAFPRDRARETTTSGDVTATANGTLFKVPAGNAGATFKVGASSVGLDSESRRQAVETPGSLSRTVGSASVNFDLPISRRGREFSALGNLTLNLNAELDQLSDFGSLTTIGAGANWSPVDRLNLITSWTREEGPPTIQQLGDPLLITPGSRIFDFARGETAIVTVTTGGNEDLQSDRRNVLKFGANWQPSSKLDLRLRADYVHQRIENPISGISVTPAIEAAFSGRFIRAAPLPGETVGQLVSVDLRPVNFDHSQRDQLRVGFDFSKPLKSRRPSQALLDQMRAQFGIAPRVADQGGTPGAPGAAPPPEGGRDGGRGFGGRGGGGGFGGGGNRGRLTFSLTDTITFEDKVTIAPGLELDYLHGDAAGSSGGTPRHLVEARAGYFNNGLGARLSANYRSGTRVDSLTGDDLRFSPLATFDLRLFANPGDIPELVLKHRWLRGTQVQFTVANIFDAKPKVRNAAGDLPLNFQPDLLDPLGRTIGITIRKLFLPPPSFFRRAIEERQQQQPSTTPPTG
ncbi:MAG TPA: TonB-dependent receptor plug domain-containing protein [Sphingomicrobium sp.]|nr:TonB-dependent receptor plug domain-containing protein [Sphingomicrobium sp.]